MRGRRLVTASYSIYFNLPLLSQLIDTLRVIVLKYTESLYCLNEAVAVAVELCFVADFEASLKVMEGHVVDTEALVQLEDDPLYVKVPVTVIVHKIFPLDALYVYVLLADFVDELRERVAMIFSSVDDSI